MIQQKIDMLYRKMEESSLLRCIRSSLVMLIPILLIGSFATVLQYLPIDSYQSFLATFADGILVNIFDMIYAATSGMVSVYMTISLAMSYSQQKSIHGGRNSFGMIFTATACFALWSGVGGAEFNIANFGTTGMFTAILCGLGASALYDRISNKMRYKRSSLADGADETFQTMLFALLPMIVVLLVCLLLYIFMIQFLHFTSFTELFSAITHGIFAHMGRSLGSTVLYEIVLNLLWFFGIHGGDVLEFATENLFNSAMGVNAELVGAEIYNGSFLNVFVAMGGCGTIWCLLLAILIFSKRRNNRKLAKLAMIPGVFNISEILIFGVPVVFNPIFFIPFLLTPIVMILTSAFAMSIGWVPAPYNTISWTTPIIMGGYMATDSIAGAILQIVNLAIGVMIYAPFVKMYDNACMRDSERKIKNLVAVLQKSEQENKPVELLELQGESGIMAKMLSEELKHNMEQKLPTMYYQPQYDKEGNCIGVEALLRWIHPAYSLIYPPLVIKLAGETGKLLELEKKIFQSVIRDAEQLKEILPPNAKLSVNVTGETIQRDEFSGFLAGLKKEYPEECQHIMIEITEQEALQLDDSLIAKLMKIREMGFGLAIDDFSMGSTSIKYLQTNIFNVIKLDGSISRSVLHNKRSCSIVESVTKLANDMDIDVIAEFVENEEQRDILEKVDCNWYQGALYGLAVPLDRLEERISQNNVRE